MLGIVNACAWYLAWDDARARGDAAAAARALVAMTDEVPAHAVGDPAGAELARDIARRATAGDPDGARGHVAANCDRTEWEA